MKLENWSVVINGSPYTPPELCSRSLHGEIYNHPSFEDGEIIRTSKIAKVEKGKVITHSGSEYELGNASKEYEELYPNAKERLFADLS